MTLGFTPNLHEMILGEVDPHPGPLPMLRT